MHTRVFMQRIGNDASRPRQTLGKAENEENVPSAPPFLGLPLPCPRGTPLLPSSRPPTLSHCGTTCPGRTLLCVPPSKGKSDLRPRWQVSLCISLEYQGIRVSVTLIPGLVVGLGAQLARGGWSVEEGVSSVLFRHWLESGQSVQR